MRDKHLVNDQLGTAFCIEGFGRLAASAGEPRRAAVLFGAAERMWGLIGRPLVGFGDLLEWSEEADRRVRHDLDETSYQDARRCGAELTTEAAVAYALGEHAPSSAGTLQAAPEDELTKRELEVVELVTAGMTDREIAGNLVIAIRTAESHIEHTLTKLGFTSRAQIAAWSAGQQESAELRPYAE